MTLRYVRLRVYDGNVHYVPNSLITTVTNMSRGFAFAVMDIGVAYRETPTRCSRSCAGVGAQLRCDPAFEAKVPGTNRRGKASFSNAPTVVTVVIDRRFREP